MELETGIPEARQGSRMVLTEGELLGWQEPAETGMKNWLTYGEEEGDSGLDGTSAMTDASGEYRKLTASKLSKIFTEASCNFPLEAEVL